MKKRLLTAALALILVAATGFVNSSLAAVSLVEFQKEARPVVDPNKEWTILVNKDFDGSSLEEVVKVFTDTGDAKSVSVSKKSSREILVRPSGAGYVPGTYSLNIRGLKGTDGNLLRFEYSMSFTVRGDNRTVFLENTDNNWKNVKSPTDVFDQPLTNGAPVVNPKTGSVGVVEIKKEDSPNGDYQVRVVNPVPEPIVPSKPSPVERNPNFNAGDYGITKCGSYEIPAANFNRSVGTVFYAADGSQIGILTDILRFRDMIRINIACPIADPIGDPDTYYDREVIDVNKDYNTIDGSKAHVAWIENGHLFWSGGDGLNIKTVYKERLSVSGIIEVASNQKGVYYLYENGSVGAYLNGKYETLSELGSDNARIAAGEGFVLTLSNYGQVKVYGSNMYGEHGNGHYGGNPIKPTVIDKLPPVTSIAANAHTVCAVTKSGELYMWGQNLSRFIPVPGTNVTTPTKIEIPGRVKQAACDRYGVFVLMEDGSLYAWGGMTLNLPNTPSKVSDLGDHIVKFSYKNGHILALRKDGRVLALGSNEFGQIGNGKYGELGNLNNLYLIGFSGARIVKVGTGERSSYALDQDGNLWVWGSGLNGQLGLGEKGQRAKVTIPIIMPTINQALGKKG